MELKTDNYRLIELNDGCLELLAIDDLETLFSYRVSCIVEVLSSKIKAYSTARAKLDLKFATVEVTDEDGRVTAKRATDENADEYDEEIRRLMDIGVELKVPKIRLSEIHRMREEEGVPIDASTIHSIRHVTVPDMDLEDGVKPDAAQAAEDETEEPSRKGRAERVRERPTNPTTARN